MNQEVTEFAESSIPPHVPASLVRDIDVFNIQSIDPDVHLGWRRVQTENPPVFFTPRNGGHWIMSSAELIDRLFQEPETFRSRHANIPPLPAGAPEALPINADGSDHQAYRSFITPFFLARKLTAAITRARALAVELIEDIAPRGECDFAVDFAQHLPIQVFLDLVELPSTDRPILLQFAELVRLGEGPVREAAHRDLMQYLGGWIAKRQAEPGDDMISAIIKGTINNRPMTPQEILGECFVILLGGLDTVASMMGFIANFLAGAPDIRRQLVENPAMIPNSIDELMRRFGVAAPSRVVAYDMEVEGVALKQGDRIYVGSAFHGLDESRWPDALTVDLKRRPKNTQTFGGTGPHRCPGAALARAEVTIFLEEWLKRIPDFSVKPGTRAIAATGSVNGVSSLQLVWDVKAA
jgi:cytochrome P450